MELERIEVFEREEKQVLYYDLSSIKTNAELAEVIASAKEAISVYGHNSVYTITNITRIAFDSKTKELASDWMAFNKPFVIGAAFIGVTGVRKIMMEAVFALSSRKNVHLFHDMDEALSWLDSL